MFTKDVAHQGEVLRSNRCLVPKVLHQLVQLLVQKLHAVYELEAPNLKSDELLIVVWNYVYPVLLTEGIGLLKDEVAVIVPQVVKTMGRYLLVK